MTSWPADFRVMRWVRKNGWTEPWKRTDKPGEEEDQTAPLLVLATPLSSISVVLQHFAESAKRALCSICTIDFTLVQVVYQSANTLENARIDQAWCFISGRCFWAGFCRWKWRQNDHPPNEELSQWRDGSCCELLSALGGTRVHGHNDYLAGRVCNCPIGKTWVWV